VRYEERGQGYRDVEKIGKQWYRGMAGGTAVLFFIENDGSLITALDRMHAE
jgi:hypothetical protein